MLSPTQKTHCDEICAFLLNKRAELAVEKLTCNTPARVAEIDERLELIDADLFAYSGEE